MNPLDYETAHQERSVALNALQRLISDIGRITSPPPSRVLIVDDQPESAQLLATQLADEFGPQVEIVLCTDPHEALARIHNEDWAALIFDADLQDPDLNGVTLAQHAPSHRPRALYSGRVDIDDAARALGIHALAKPCDAQGPAFRALVDDVLGGLRATFA